MLCEHGDLWQIEMLITDRVERDVKSAGHCYDAALWGCESAKKSGDVERKGSVFTLCAVKLVQQVIRCYLKVVNILKNRPKLHTGCLHSHYIHITIIIIKQAKRLIAWASSSSYLLRLKISHIIICIVSCYIFLCIQAMMSWLFLLY